MFAKLKDYEKSKWEFKKDARRVAIRNFPIGTQKCDIQQFLRDYCVETIHTDKAGESCKVVFWGPTEASRCISNIARLGEARGWPNLEGSYTASDFMICVSHFPLDWNEDRFKTLIRKFGETEKCFLVHSEFLEHQSMGYGFMEFTAKTNAIRARNELHGHIIWEGNKKYRIQVHWVNRIPETYDKLQSQTIFCHGWSHSRNLECMRTIEIYKPTYFNVSQLKSENFAIVEYGTHEMAAQTVKLLRLRYDIQVSFSIPEYRGIVLLKSFETFYKEFIEPNESFGRKFGNGLLPKPIKTRTPEVSYLPSPTCFSMDSVGSSGSASEHIRDGEFAKLSQFHFNQMSQPESVLDQRVMDQKMLMAFSAEQELARQRYSPPSYNAIINETVFGSNNENNPVSRRATLPPSMQYKDTMLMRGPLCNGKIMQCRQLSANLFGKEGKTGIETKWDDRLGRIDNAIYDRELPLDLFEPDSLSRIPLPPLPTTHPFSHPLDRVRPRVNITTSPQRDQNRDSPISRNLLGSTLVKLIDSNSPTKESWPGSLRFDALNLNTPDLTLSGRKRSRFDESIHSKRRMCDSQTPYYWENQLGVNRWGFDLNPGFDNPRCDLTFQPTL